MDYQKRGRPWPRTRPSKLREKSLLREKNNADNEQIVGDEDLTDMIRRAHDHNDGNRSKRRASADLPLSKEDSYKRQRPIVGIEDEYVKDYLLDENESRSGSRSSLAPSESSSVLLHSHVKPIAISNAAVQRAPTASYTSLSPQRTSDHEILSSIPHNFSSFSFSERKKVLNDLLPSSLRNDPEYKSHLSKMIRKNSLGRRSSDAMNYLNSFTLGSSLSSTQSAPDNVNEGGSVILSKWKLGSVFNSGAFGTIRNCQNVNDPGDNRAMKVIDVYDSGEFQCRFKTEAVMWSILDHPNILPLQDFLLSNRSFFLLMPKVSGGSLYDIVKMWEAYQLPIKERLPRIVNFLADLCSALSYMHSIGTYHGDIKLENCLVDSIQGDKLLLCDFGMTHFFDETLQPTPQPALTQRLLDQTEMLQCEPSSTSSSRRNSIRAPPEHKLPDDRIGSLPYAAPELLQQNVSSLDNLTDMWAFGVMIYILVTLKLPFCNKSEPLLKSQILHCDYDTGLFHDSLAGYHVAEMEELLHGCITKRANRLSAPPALAKLRRIQSLF